MLIAILLALGASTALLAAGWLAGARRGRLAREELRRLAADEASQRAQTTEAAGAAEARAAALEREAAGARAQIARLSEVKQQLDDIVRVIAQRERGEQGLRERLEAKLQPLLEGATRGRSLGELDAAVRADLPGLLDDIARRGRLATVVLSDASGLALAGNRGGKDVDLHAGGAALFLNLIDRVVATEQPAPIAAVWRDEANQSIVHRVFRLGEERYVLTAVAVGATLAPEVLDPALTALQRALHPRSAA